MFSPHQFISLIKPGSRLWLRIVYIQGLVFGGKPERPASWEREARLGLTSIPYSPGYFHSLHSFIALPTRQDGFRSQGVSSLVAILGLGAHGNETSPHGAPSCFWDPQTFLSLTPSQCAGLPSSMAFERPVTMMTGLSTGPTTQCRWSV